MLKMFSMGKFSSIKGYYKTKKKRFISETLFFILWEHTGSNRGPSACKADALNQLSYAPFFVGGSAKISV
jgi:hypothetical protein